MITDPRTRLLGNGDPALNMPVIGYIRGGVKRLVRPRKDATEQEIRQYEADCKLYDTYVAMGLSWDDIEKKLGPNKEGKSKLVPENRDYFTVREIDCKTYPENAAILHKLYADPDGKIRRLPIVFLFNDWFQNSPHELISWGGDKRWKYRMKARKVVNAETGEEGYEFDCVMPAPNEKGKRPFGAKDYRLRGPCDPDNCPEYQSKKCDVSGYVQGCIPGTKGMGVWRIGSKSIYSFRQMMSKMETVSLVTGRLNGLFDNKTGKPILSILKVSDEEITRFDIKEGKSIRTEQDLIYLEADVDMCQLMLAYQDQAVLARGRHAMTAITTGRIDEKVKEEPTQEPVITDQEPEPEEERADFTAEVEHVGQCETDVTEGHELTDEEERAALLGAIIPAFNHLPAKEKNQLRKEYGTDIAKLSLDELRNMDRDVKAAVKAA